jgi:hypothetical protein
LSLKYQAETPLKDVKNHAFSRQQKELLEVLKKFPYSIAMLDLQKLTEAPEEQRNEKWEEDFLNAFVPAYVKLVHPDPKPGPDSWPYMMVETKEDGEDSVKEILKWLSEKGIGMVVNANKSLPDYVFTYGMIWNYRETGHFLEILDEKISDKFELDLGSKYYYGTPTEKFLPGYVRKILKEFFLHQGVFAPKILLLSQDGKNFDLCFSMESLKNPPPKEHEGILEAISWFLPSHYSLAMVSTKGLPPFQDL